MGPKDSATKSGSSKDWEPYHGGRPVQRKPRTVLASTLSWTFFWARAREDIAASFDEVQLLLAAEEKEWMNAGEAKQKMISSNSVVFTFSWSCAWRRKRLGFFCRLVCGESLVGSNRPVESHLLAPDRSSTAMVEKR